MNPNPLRSFCPQMEALEGREVPTVLSLPGRPATKPVAAVSSNQQTTPVRVVVTPAPPRAAGTIAPLNPYTRSTTTTVNLLTASLFPFNLEAPQTATLSGNYDPGLYYSPLSVTGLPKEALNTPPGVRTLSTASIITPTPPLETGGFTMDASGVIHGTSLFS